jgi:hypothetical protein
MSTKTVHLTIERIRTEFADVEVEIDVAEFEEWQEEALGGAPMNAEEVCEFVEAHRDRPENIRQQIDRARWDADQRPDFADEFRLHVTPDVSR